MICSESYILCLKVLRLLNIDTKKPPMSGGCIFFDLRHFTKKWRLVRELNPSCQDENLES